MSGLQINRQAQDENSIVTTLESYLREKSGPASANSSSLTQR
jgi:hypothetical protein